jgi:N-methylhydantoinase A
LQKLSSFNAADANTLYGEMHAEAEAIVRRAAPDAPLEEERHAFMRYRGQGHEVMVPLSVGRYGEGDGARLAEAFAAAYRALYSRTIPGVDIEVVSWALSLRAPIELAVEKPQRAEAYVPQPSGRRSLFDPGTGETIEVPVYRRGDLRPGAQIAGPALIVEDETSTVVSPAFDATIDGYGYIELRRRSE